VASRFSLVLQYSSNKRPATHISPSLFDGVANVDVIQIIYYYIVFQGAAESACFDGTASARPESCLINETRLFVSGIPDAVMRDLVRMAFICGRPYNYDSNKRMD
jgi:uncharacterized protein (DUF2461 family)